FFFIALAANISLQCGQGAGPFFTVFGKLLLALLEAGFGFCQLYSCGLNLSACRFQFAQAFLEGLQAGYGIFAQILVVGHGAGNFTGFVFIQMARPGRGVSLRPGGPYLLRQALPLAVEGVGELAFLSLEFAEALLLFLGLLAVLPSFPG